MDFWVHTQLHCGAMHLSVKEEIYHELMEDGYQ